MSESVGGWMDERMDRMMGGSLDKWYGLIGGWINCRSMDG